MHGGSAGPRPPRRLVRHGQPAAPRPPPRPPGACAGARPVATELMTTLALAVRARVPGVAPLRLQNERCDLRVNVSTERAGAARRHGGLHQRQQLARGPAAPGVHEIPARERRGLVAAREIGQVASGTILLIRRAASRGLGRGERSRAAGRCCAITTGPPAPQHQHRTFLQTAHWIAPPSASASPTDFPSGAFSLSIWI